MPNQWSKYFLIVSVTSLPCLSVTYGYADTGAVGTDAAQLQQQVQEQSRKIDEARRKLAEQESLQLQTRRNLEQAQRELDRLKLQVGLPTSAPVQRAPAAQPVGEAPETQPLQVAQIFEQPGVLTPRGKFVVEPSLQYAYSTSNRLALVGYTIIPALLIGVIDVREVKRTTWLAALTTRYGVTNRLEVEARIPYVYRSDDSVGREVLQGTATDTAFNATGNDLGDIELTARYQFNDGGADSPYYIGTLRVKTRTGSDPFESEVSTGVSGFRSGIETELATGSGFYGVQPGLTMLYPSDPAVFFGSISYLYSFERSDLRQRTDNGDLDIGDVQPGGVFQFNFGMGLALNERSSFSIGYDHSSVGKLRQNGKALEDAVTVQLATLLLGFSYQLEQGRSFNISLGTGLTADTPDVTLTMRMPMSF
jgi:hypothetical protein